MHHIVPFSFMSFSSSDFSYKVFNEETSIQEHMPYLLFFPTGVFKEGILRHSISPPSQGVLEMI
jgi:hypothetical protein